MIDLVRRFLVQSGRGVWIESSATTDHGPLTME